MKTIGVLGGMGPQATLEFERQVHRVSQEVLPARGNSGYPPMVVWYHRHPPAALDETGAFRMPPEPHPGLLEGARFLGQVADFLVVTSNGVHKLREALEAAAGRPILSMIDVTLAEVERRGWRRVGVLCMGGPQVYAEPLEARGLAWESLPAELQLPLNAAILTVMEGREDDACRAHARAAVAAVRSRGADGLILGCTELPFLLPEELDRPDVLNPGVLLARAAVRHALPVPTAAPG